MKGMPKLAGVVLAGSSPRETDPLAPYTQGKPKGLLPIAGRPMLAYVVEALAGSRYICSVIVVGLPPEARPDLSVPVTYLPPHGDLIRNAEAGVCHAFQTIPDLTGVVVSSSDIPLLTPRIVDLFVEECLRTDHDIYYSIVERSVMEGRFPTSRRSYVRLSDGEFAGGDIFLVRAGARMADPELWRRVTNARKSALAQAQLIGGLWAVLKLLLGRMSLAEAERRASRALEIRGRAVVCPHPEVGMDVDKPFQLEIVRSILERE
ncbi:MAG: nucleotidyltransferase family protein [Anaerolineae bacterium]|nr:nucleotidyltransferase family protein [Anaerolineae bacterium]MDW7992177.1 nucleotidyltransferase family protein [Anaerolineae bacterium]